MIGQLAGKSFNVWFESQEKMEFTNFPLTLQNSEEATTVSPENNVADGELKLQTYFFGNNFDL